MLLFVNTGVSDSQIDNFVRREIREYRKVFDDLNIKPNLAVIVVQKRIGSRYFIMGNNREYISPPVGAVIDKDVVSGQFNNFDLLASKAPASATAGPARFITTVDDMSMSSDGLQQFTYQLCYLYYNWQGSVKIPAPAKYADSLAYKFATHMQKTTVHPNLFNKLFFL